MNETEVDRLRDQLEAAVHDAESLASRLSGIRLKGTPMTDEVQGKAIEVVSGAELNDKIALYRTACVALLALVRREGGYMDPADQMLIRQIERMIDKDHR